jgi:hypothetical protein
MDHHHFFPQILPIASMMTPFDAGLALANFNFSLQAGLVRRLSVRLTQTPPHPLYLASLSAIYPRRTGLTSTCVCHSIVPQESAGQLLPRAPHNAHFPGRQTPRLDASDEQRTPFEPALLVTLSPHRHPSRPTTHISYLTSNRPGWTRCASVLYTSPPIERLDDVYVRDCLLDPVADHQHKKWPTLSLAAVSTPLSRASRLLSASLQSSEVFVL